MKKLIATMIVSVIMGQPILAGPLSMAQWRLTGDPKLPGRFQYADTKYVGAPTMQKAKSPWVKLGYAGALAFSLLSWQQLGQASDNEAEAVLNREHGQEARAQDRYFAGPTYTVGFSYTVSLIEKFVRVGRGTS